MNATTATTNTDTTLPTYTTNYRFGFYRVMYGASQIAKFDLEADAREHARRLNAGLRRVRREKYLQPQERAMLESIADRISPAAGAAIAAYLQPATTNDPDVNAEIAWFRDAMVEYLGVENYNRETEQLGL